MTISLFSEKLAKPGNREWGAGEVGGAGKEELLLTHAQNLKFKITVTETDS